MKPFSLKNEIYVQEQGRNSLRASIATLVRLVFYPSGFGLFLSLQILFKMWLWPLLLLTSRAAYIYC